MMQQAFAKKFIFLLLFSAGIFIVQHTLMVANIHAAEKKNEDVKKAYASKEAEPKFNHTKEEVYKPPRSWFDRNKWWVALGTVIVGGAVAAAAAGGGSSSGDDGNTGSYAANWQE